MRIVGFALACAALVAGCASVHQEDLDAWKGRPVSDLDKHPLTLVASNVVRVVTADGTEMRDYVNGQNVAQCSSGGSVFRGTVNMASYNGFMSCMQRFQACHSIYTIKDGVVQSVSAIGTGGARCYTNETMRPGFSGSVNM